MDGKNTALDAMKWSLTAVVWGLGLFQVLEADPLLMKLAILAAMLPLSLYLHRRGPNYEAV